MFKESFFLEFKTKLKENNITILPFSKTVGGLSGAGEAPDRNGISYNWEDTGVIEDNFSMKRNFALFKKRFSIKNTGPEIPDVEISGEIDPVVVT